ncbi:hypothetical protein GJAV_G00005010 [Gymnothorax javanicus]|nr:hypothetical protein GJAV_G00005010 [Gymnothorax javanicus]
MLRLLILCLVLSAAVTSETQEENEASGDNEDDEDGRNIVSEDQVQGRRIEPVGSGPVPVGTVDSKASDQDGFTTAAIIAAVCVVALAAVAIIAVILVRRHMQNRQQGVYSVPVEQSVKSAI